MDGSSLLAVVAVLLLAAWLGRRVYRRPNDEIGASAGARANGRAGGGPAGRGAAGAVARKCNAQLHIPSRKRACRGALAIAGKQFSRGAVPPLPLPRCSASHRCRCRFIEVADRRSRNRRSEQERRWGERGEADGSDRRSGNDRRVDGAAREAHRSAAAAALAARSAAERIRGDAAATRIFPGAKDVGGPVGGAPSARRP